jgi:EpsI family protein
MAIRVGVPFLAAAALLAATSIAASYLQREKPRKPGRPLAAFPATLGNWKLDRTDVVPARVVERLRCTDFLARSYSSRNREASLFIAYYAEQRAGAGTHSPKSCLPGAGWEIWNYATERVDVSGLAETINRYSIQNQQERAVVFYWYQNARRIVASEYQEKAYLLFDGLTKRDRAGSLVRVIVPDRPDADADGAAFAQQVIPEMQRILEP